CLPSPIFCCGRNSFCYNALVAPFAGRRPPDDGGTSLDPARTGRRRASAPEGTSTRGARGKIMANPILDVQKYGQSIWYDNIRRGLITSGELAGMVEKDGLLGVTSNPAIFTAAITGSPDYDQPL